MANSISLDAPPASLFTVDTSCCPSISLSAGLGTDNRSVLPVAAELLLLEAAEPLGQRLS